MYYFSFLKGYMQDNLPANICELNNAQVTMDSICILYYKSLLPMKGWKIDSFLLFWWLKNNVYTEHPRKLILYGSHEFRFK